MPTEALQLQPAWLDAQQPRAGRYVLGPLLGQGGMGEVREAWDVVLRRSVALKILKAMDPVSLIRFVHEAQLHARVVHPHICRIYDVESAEGAPRIAMQLVRGENLADAAHRLSIRELIPLFAQVAEAVHAAHRLKLIHRDLKPSNILLEPGPDGAWLPYVCDFGLALALDEPALTYSMGIKGTPAFMAPEQIRGERHLIGPATDVYAMGGTLYFALFGLAPLGPTADLDLLLGRRRAPAVLPRCPKGHLPRELETLLTKCLEPDPALRFTSMATLAEELWRLHNGVPIRTQPVGFLGRHVPFFRKHRRGWALAALGAGALLLGLVVTQRNLSQRTEGRAEMARFFALEAADLENDLRVEKMLPIHDLRPAYARVRRHMRDLRTRMDALGPDAEGPGLYALGRARFLLGDFPGAQQDLERAWSKGSRGPEVANLLARTLVGAQCRADSEARFNTGLPSPQWARTAQRVAALFTRGRGLATEPDDYARALTAYSQRDFTQAASAAHASFLTHPWHYESASTEALSLCALGRQKYEAGDLAGAERSYRDAMEAARRFLALGQSDESVHHAFLLAGRGLAYLQRLGGTLTLATLDQLLGHGRNALNLDPDHPGLQDDFLALSILKATRMAELGQDPGPEVDAALAFLATRVQEPASPELRADRMLVNWVAAETRFARGEDPGPALREALKDAGHTTFMHRDFLGDLLNFKARVEAAQGLDPRPTLEATQARLLPLLEHAPCWSLCETAAEAYVIRATWEAQHGQNAKASLRSAQWFAGRALQGNAASPAGYALEGLTWALERRAEPERRQLLTTMAQERLRTSLAQGSAGRLQDQLKRVIQES
jgi:serine/threonine-protein kinase